MMSFLLLPDKAQYTIVDHLSAHDTMRLVMTTSERAAKDLCAAMGHCLDDRLRRAKARQSRGFHVNYGYYGFDAYLQDPTHIKLRMLRKVERRDWYITPDDDVSEQLQKLFMGRDLMKHGDHIVFAPGTYHLDATTVLYDIEDGTVLPLTSQFFRNITLRGTGGDPSKVIICAAEGCRLDHLFFVCREPGERIDPEGDGASGYCGPEHPVIHFSGLTFRNDHLTRGRNAIVCAIGDVDVVMDDCRVLCPHDAPTSGYMYHNAQNREAAKAAVAAAEPDLPAKEANQAVMKKLVEMWGALDDAAKQKYKDDAPGRRQNMLGKFRQPLFLGIAAGRVNQYRRALYGYDY